MSSQRASAPGYAEAPWDRRSSLSPDAGGSSGKSRRPMSPSTTSAWKASPCTCPSRPPRQTRRPRASGARTGA
eukprot:6298874-Alexandrium_andersonii.AAC.1